MSLNPVSVFHTDQDLATCRTDMGGPIGFSSRGRRTPRNVRVPADVWKLSLRPAFWSDISLWLGKVLPFVSGPVSAPTIPRGQSKAKGRPEELQGGPHTCTVAPWDGDGEAGNSFWKGVEIIDVL